MRVLHTIKRALYRNRGYGIFNIFGLAIGIACSLLIFLWVEDELTYNYEFKNRDNLYKVMLTMESDGKTNVWSATPPILAEVIEREIPEIKNVTRITRPQKVTFTFGENELDETGFYCDPSFFSMFGVQFVIGNPESAFPNPFSIVLTEKTAKKFFAEENPVGKTLKIDRKETYTVTAVIKDFPENVSFRFNWLIPFQMFMEQNVWANFNWFATCLEATIVELHHSANVQQVNKKLIDTQSTHRKSDVIGAFLFNMNDWHL